MGEDQRAESTVVTDSTEAEQIREDIEATREELGNTVAALSAKTDIKAQAKRKVDETKATVADKKDELLGKARETSPDSAVTAAAGASEKARENPLPVAALGAFVLGFLAGRTSKR